jgi:hypothetical protein
MVYCETRRHMYGDCGIGIGYNYEHFSENFVWVTGCQAMYNRTGGGWCITHSSDNGTDLDRNNVSIPVQCHKLTLIAQNLGIACEGGSARGETHLLSMMNGAHKEAISSIRLQVSNSIGYEWRRHRTCFYVVAYIAVMVAAEWRWHDHIHVLSHQVIAVTVTQDGSSHLQ